MKKYDKNVLETYEIGDLVLLDRRGYWPGGPYQKTKDIYLGPFKVVKRLIRMLTFLTSTTLIPKEEPIMSNSSRNTFLQISISSNHLKPNN